MTITNKLVTLAAGLVMTMAAFGQTATTVKDYIGVAGPIVFDKINYQLAWSAHPNNNYYKQEYLATGDSLEKFKRLITIDVLSGQANLKDIVSAKIAELNKIKATNPVVQFQTFEKAGEYMLDFLMSENTPDGKQLTTVERNVYRYKIITVGKGQKAVLLLGVSDRAYGNDIDLFFQQLKEHRFDLVNAVGAFALPEITIAQ